MANFGFEHLSVVAPWEPHWREAKSAVGAEPILEAAQVAGSIPEALAACTMVVGTGSLETRKPEQTAISLPDLAPLVAQELVRGGRVALLFGPEKRGLTRDDLAHCHLLVEIPTQAHQPSMNLGHAVAVCLYELASRLTPQAAASEIPQSQELRANAARLAMLEEVIGAAMIAAEYSPAAMDRANRHDLRLLLRRLALSESDARRILGLFRRVLWRLRH